MAYLELSKEAYNDIIMAAGIKGAKVAKVCEMQGVWSEEAAAEEPALENPADEIDSIAVMSDMLVENEARLEESQDEPGTDDDGICPPMCDDDDEPEDPLMETSDD